MDKIYDQFDIETIEKLADIVNSKELSELTLTDGDKTITLKGKKLIPAPPVPFVPAPLQPAESAAPVTGELAPTEAATAGEISGKLVKSPIVGTFYAAPSPDKPPFVRVGDEVKKGDVIMIIESMKLMNEIQSEYDGIVDKILVSDGQAVEYDQPVMVIK
ncbi:MAG: acetyl-CoA carboxylase biotin carboxyl carrier protein [Ruminococcus sp.]|uniref:acetyl-CoA carboxylase biotin carboxyl carrier protein n=1 Tax=uncultured Ruminococcus sp. TaxID=165186 RepID=UPI0015669D76|nr:acetyl-CoA carboxylase biotin carboxyl carrier protein [uncultured Ruminococcus sp.]MCR4862485.1 acetyl-CoA carboxylase biotin carboxyl carrier protein [Ruminococcus sp.]